MSINRGDRVTHEDLNGEWIVDYRYQTGSLDLRKGPDELSKFYVPSSEADKVKRVHPPEPLRGSAVALNGEVYVRVRDEWHAHTADGDINWASWEYLDVNGGEILHRAGVSV